MGIQLSKCIFIFYLFWNARGLYRHVVGIWDTSLMSIFFLLRVAVSVTAQGCLLFQKKRQYPKQTFLWILAFSCSFPALSWMYKVARRVHTGLEWPFHYGFWERASEDYIKQFQHTWYCPVLHDKDFFSCGSSDFFFLALPSFSLASPQKYHYIVLEFLFLYTCNIF